MWLLVLACAVIPPLDAADSAPPPACGDVWVDGVFQPDPTGATTQIHGTSAFGPAGLWLAWSVPNEHNTFDIRVARLGCDGQVQVGPIALTDGPDNELDPVLAVGEDRVLVAWTSSSDAPNNLDIRYALLDGSGDVLRPGGDLVASRDGAVVEGNATAPDAAAINGGFVLAGMWGHDQAPGFQAFYVVLDDDGEVIGSAVDAELDPEFGQTEVDLTLDPTPVLAWQEDSTTSSAPVSYRAGQVLGETSARPDVAGPWTAWDDDAGTVTVRTPGGQDRSIESRAFHHSPALAAWGDTAVVLTQRADDGIYNSLQLTLLGEDAFGDTLALAAVANPSVYGADVTLVDATHAVVVWQEGDNPDFMLRAQLLTLEAP